MSSPSPAQIKSSPPRPAILSLPPSPTMTSATPACPTSVLAFSSPTIVASAPSQNCGSPARVGGGHRDDRHERERAGEQPREGG
jgi:hypothetical protein